MYRCPRAVRRAQPGAQAYTCRMPIGDGEAVSGSLRRCAGVRCWPSYVWPIWFWFPSFQAHGQDGGMATADNDVLPVSRDGAGTPGVHCTIVGLCFNRPSDVMGKPLQLVFRIGGQCTGCRHYSTVSCIANRKRCPFLGAPCRKHQKQRKHNRKLQAVTARATRRAVAGHLTQSFPYRFSIQVLLQILYYFRHV